MDTAIDYEIVRGLEDTIAAKRLEVLHLEDSLSQIAKVGSQQSKALKHLGASEEMEEKTA